MRKRPVLPKVSCMYVTASTLMLVSIDLFDHQLLLYDVEIDDRIVKMVHI